MKLEIVPSCKLSNNDLAKINKFRKKHLVLKFQPNRLLQMRIKMGCISTVIVIQKGKGYGARVLSEIQKYAKKNSRTLLGFCEPDFILYKLP